MARDGSLELEVGGELRRFQFTMGAWEKIQDAVEMGPERFYQPLTGPDWKPSELSVVLYATLEAGGLDALAARALAADIVKPGHLIEARMIALSVIAAGLSQADDEEVDSEPQPGKPEAAAETSTPRSKTARPTSRKSTGKRQPRSSGRQGKSAS